jgi:hypothetical protein
MTAPSPLSITPRKPAQSAAEPCPQKYTDTPESLLALGDQQFAAKVAYDARRSQRPDMLDALRDPQVAARWAAALRTILDNLQRDLDTPGRLEGTAEHRARTYCGNVRKRLAEASAALAGNGGAL